MENKYNSRVPLQRIAALVIMDMMSILLVSFAALYIRYDFSFQDIDPMFFKHCENLLIPNIIGTLFFFVLWKLYRSVWRYASANELVNIVGALPVRLLHSLSIVSSQTTGCHAAIRYSISSC